MLRKYIFLATLALISATSAVAQSSDTLFVRYDNRFKANAVIPIDGADSLLFYPSNVRIYEGENSSARTYSSILPNLAGEFSFVNPGRILLQANQYSGNNYTNEQATSGYNFSHSMESDHYAVFWDVRYGNDPTKIQYPGDGNVANAKTILNICERCWNKYVELGFIVPGASTTDKYKIQLYIPYQKEWRADAAGDWGVGYVGKTGIGHFNPWAAVARGGHTVAHEVGHTFQFLVSADIDENHGWRWGYTSDGSGDCGWWESCADWQAYQLFPERQFTDGEYFEQHLANHHLNLLHEDWRYACCYIQDYWVMKYGKDFIGRMWRETQKPEDPVQTYKRMNGLTQEQFNDEMMEGYMRMATWDIDGVRERAAHRIGQHKNFLKKVSGTTATYKSDVDHCIQNYGYTIINMKTATAGTEVKAEFTGLAGADGWNKVNTQYAGWRYAFVALSSDGTRTYGTVQKDKEGTASLIVPENCINLFFVVMGAPTQHWPHPWTSGKASSSWPQNEEQWPFQVAFVNTTVK